MLTISNMKEELSRMETLGVIEKITHPTNWRSPMVPAVNLKWKVCSCVEMNKANEQVERERHMLLTTGEVLAKRAGAKVFSSLNPEGFGRFLCAVNAAW